MPAPDPLASAVIKSCAFGLAALVMAFTPSASFAKLSQTGTGSGQWTGEGPAGISYTGSTNRVTVADNGTTITVTAYLGNVTANNALDTQRVRSALETAKYPTASLKVKHGALRFLASHASASGSASGSLEMHGASKSVKFHYQASLTGSTYLVKLTAVVDINDFGIVRPDVLGVTIKPNVRISASFSAVDR